LSFVLRGTSIPQLQNYKTRFDPSRGLIYEATWKGISYNNLYAQFVDFINAGIEAEIEFQNGGVSVLHGVDSTQTFTIDNWQIVGNSENTDVFSHPTVLSLATNDQIGAIRNGINLITGGKPTSEAISAIFTDPLLATLSPSAQAILSRFIGLNLRGSTDYKNPAYVLRHTTNVSNRWNVNVADFNINSIYTLATFLSEISNFGFWFFPCPARLQYKISNLAVPSPQSNYQVGWLKQPSTETTEANNRVQIAQEYIYGQWSTDDYPNVV
jgi:hypothetical protein